MGKGNNIHVLRNLPLFAPTSIGVSKDVRVYVRACVHSEGEKKRDMMTAKTGVMLVKNSLIPSIQPRSYTMSWLQSTRQSIFAQHGAPCSRAHAMPDVPKFQSHVPGAVSFTLSLAMDKMHRP